MNVYDSNAETEGGCGKADVFIKNVNIEILIRVVLGAPQRNDLRCELERSLAFVPAGRSVFLRDATKMLRFGPQHITVFGARSPRPPS
jgi:hypothetical protein